jgi:long-subunit fatty acid transport protein
MKLKQCIRKWAGLMLLMSVFSTAVAVSQTTVSYTTPTLGIGARAAALGDAYTADTQDASSLYWNPATLVFLQEPSVVFNHREDQESNAMNEDVAIPLLMGDDGIALGASVSHLGYWKDSPQGPAFRFIQYDLDMAYARVIIPHLSLGLSIDGTYGKTETSRLWVASASFGLLYSPSPGLSYGIAYQGVGWKVGYSFDSTSTALHKENQIQSLQMGVTLRFPHSPSKPSLFTLTAVNEKNFRDHALGYKAGLEIFPIRFVGLRIGYHVNKTKAAARYGVGLRLDWLQLDYAISPSRQDDRFHQVSLSIAFWK